MIFDKIVVIDDDPKVIKAIQLIFQEYEIVGFQDATSALKYLQEPHEVIVILLDVYIKEDNGIDVLNKIKQIKENTAVIMMTAFGTKEIVIEALRGHADDFIEKPFDVNDLRNKIKRILKDSACYFNLDKNTRIERIKKLIEKNCEKISLENLAEEMCLSPKYVSRLFKNNNINGFRDFKLNLKVKKAKSMLQGSSQTISQIAGSLGYQNSESFMRIFKRITGYTPTQYRFECRKQKKDICDNRN